MPDIIEAPPRFVRMGLPFAFSTTNGYVHPGLAEIAPKLASAWALHNGKCVIVHGRDGNHSKMSAHAEGKAIDLRLWTLCFGTHALQSKSWWISCIRFSKLLASILNQDNVSKGNSVPCFYVVLEQDHIHLEYALAGERPNIRGWKPGLFHYLFPELKKYEA